MCADPNGDLVRTLIFFIMYILPKQKYCLLACEPQTYFWSSLLSLWKTTSANMRDKAISQFRDVKPFVLIRCSPIRSEDRMQLEWLIAFSRAGVCLGFWRELPNMIWNVNFTTVTRFPVTLNADFFVKQRLFKLCNVMWAFVFAL